MFALKQRLALRHADLCEALDEILGCHIAQFDHLQGFKTLNVTNAMLPENPAFAHFPHLGTNDPFSSPSSRNPALADGGSIRESRTDSSALLARSGTMVSSELAAISRTCAKA